MRYLGIDYGDKRVGLAISDESGQIAFPYKVIENKGKLIEDVLGVIEREEVHKVVVGESLDFNGQPNAVMKNIELFVDELKKKSSIEIFYEPEFLTSHQAEKIQGKNELHDASAAAIILQSFLDRV